LQREQQQQQPAYQYITVQQVPLPPAFAFSRQQTAACLSPPSCFAFPFFFLAFPLFWLTLVCAPCLFKLFAALIIFPCVLRKLGSVFCHCPCVACVAFPLIFVGIITMFPCLGRLLLFAGVFGLEVVTTVLMLVMLVAVVAHYFSIFVPLLERPLSFMGGAWCEDNQLRTITLDASGNVASGDAAPTPTLPTPTLLTPTLLTPAPLTPAPLTTKLAVALTPAPLTTAAAAAARSDAWHSGSHANGSTGNFSVASYHE
jgi:hypothetical protein